MNETELARSISSGALPSPQRCAGFWIVALRITGTGLAFRKALDEHCYRAPENYLTLEFLARCGGLPVIAEHPEGTLTSSEYEARNLGSVMFGYVANDVGIDDPAGDQVWGMARVYSGEAVQAMSESPLSTSPAVVFTPADGNERAELEDGSALLIEGVPSILCHLAICDAGVWDKLGPPTGVRFDSEKGSKMTEEEQASADKARKDASDDGKVVDKLLGHLDDVVKKLDAIGGRLDALEKGEKKETAEEKEEREDRARKDLQTREHGVPWTAADAQRDRESAYACHDTQARVDPTFMAWGLRAPPPMQSETPINYRKRMVRHHQQHSKVYKDVDLDIIAADNAAFTAIESAVYADSVAASKDPISPDGRRIKRVSKGESGHDITTWHGGDSIFKQFSMPAMRATQFNIPNARDRA